MSINSTQDILKEIGKKEFLDKGYKDASLRAIAKKAGFTLGAFYGYYKNKEALFNDIVKEAADALYNGYLSCINEFAALSDEVQANDMDRETKKYLLDILDILYGDLDLYKLIFFKSAGTEYEDFMQRLIDVEISNTFRYIKLLRKMGHTIDVSEDLVHILSSSMFTGFMEVVDHDMPKEKAKKYLEQLRVFYSAGWHRLFGV